MRIGVSGYVGSRKTGIGRVLESIVMQLAISRPDIEIVLFVNYDFTDFTQKQWLSGITVVPYRVSKNSPIANILWHQGFFQQNLRHYSCDCAFIPNFSLLLWKAIPTVSLIHDMIEFNVPRKFNKWRMLYRRIAVPLMARKSDLVITVSESSKKDIVKICGIPPEKIRVIYNGVDQNFFKRIEEPQLTLELRRYGLMPGSYILYVGTIDYPGKNVHLLIESFLELRSKGYFKGKLVLAGKPGHNFFFIKKMIEGAPDNEDIVFLNYVPDESLPALYSGASLFCFFSLYEGFGLPVLEAMSCGCPVLTSNTSCFPELVGSVGACVDINDSSVVIERMRDILTSEKSRADARARGPDYCKRFSWEDAGRNYANVISEVAT